MSRTLRSAALLLSLGAAQPTAAADFLKVFAAASLTDALDEALATCDQPAIGVYAGSGTAARQIAQGAPAAIYISANPQWMDWLEQREIIVEDTRVDLLGNRLAIVATAEASEALTGGPRIFKEDKLALLTDLRIAVADTDTVPAGLYARQFFETRSLWDRPELQAALVQAANVREALAWVVRGEAGFGVVYRTDALKAPELERSEIDPMTHDPIRYPAAVIADYDSPNARGLLACLKDEKASEVFTRYGFEAPH